MIRILFLSMLPLLLINSSLSGQSTYVDEFHLKISSIEFLNKHISGDIIAGEIFIQGTEDDSIIIKAEVYNAPGKNYTCKPNECMIVDKNIFHFSIKPREGEVIKRIDIKAPSYLSFKLKLLGKGSININNINGEIQAITFRQVNINLLSCKGPLSVSGTYGDINIDFMNGISKKPMAVSLVKGNININILKNQPVTFVSSCYDDNSKLKDRQISQTNWFKSINGAIYSNPEKAQTSKRSLSINANYIEKIDNRKFIKKGAVNAKFQDAKKAFQTKEDVFVYDVNGGGTNIELNIYEGAIKINEK